MGAAHSDSFGRKRSYKTAPFVLSTLRNLQATVRAHADVDSDKFKDSYAAFSACATQLLDAVRLTHAVDLSIAKVLMAYAYVFFNDVTHGQVADMHPIKVMKGRTTFVSGTAQLAKNFKQPLNSRNPSHLKEFSHTQFCRWAPQDAVAKAMHRFFKDETKTEEERAACEFTKKLHPAARLALQASAWLMYASAPDAYFHVSKTTFGTVVQALVGKHPHVRLPREASFKALADHTKHAAHKSAKVRPSASAPITKTTEFSEEQKRILFIVWSRPLLRNCWEPLWEMVRSGCEAAKKLLGSAEALTLLSNAADAFDELRHDDAVALVEQVSVLQGLGPLQHVFEIPLDTDTKEIHEARCGNRATFALLSLVIQVAEPCHVTPESVVSQTDFRRAPTSQALIDARKRIRQLERELETHVLRRDMNRDMLLAITTDMCERVQRLGLEKDGVGAHVSKTVCDALLDAIYKTQCRDDPVTLSDAKQDMQLACEMLTEPNMSAGTGAGAGAGAHPLLTMEEKRKFAANYLQKADVGYEDRLTKLKEERERAQHRGQRRSMSSTAPPLPPPELKRPVTPPLLPPALKRPTTPPSTPPSTPSSTSPRT